MRQLMTRQLTQMPAARSLTVEGLGCIGGFGQGLGDLQRELTCALLQAFAGHERTDDNSPARRADTSALGALLPARTLRQTDHFTRMALLAALRALDNARIGSEQRDFGIILATGYGPATPTLQFMDSLIEYGETMASPLAFSHSVHNIPAASLSLKLGAAGVPCATICQMESSVTSALLTAAVWLAEGRVDRVLFGAVDERTDLLAEMSHCLAGNSRGKRRGIRRSLPVSEAAVFFCLSHDVQKNGYGRINGIELLRHPENDDWQGRLCRQLACPERTLLVSGAVPESLPAKAGEDAGIRCLAAAYGNLPIAQALDLALAVGGLAELYGTHDTICLNFSAGGLAGMICVEDCTEPQQP